MDEPRFPTADDSPEPPPPAGDIPVDETPRCEVCRALIDEEDLFCANCGREAPNRLPATATATRLTSHNFECEGCGASMSYDASAGDLRCPFCGSLKLRTRPNEKQIAPDAVVPLAISKPQAIESMRRWLGRGFWRPGDLAHRAAPVETAAVYVPYWVFRGETHTYWTADTSVTPPSARGDWFPMFGEHRGSYDTVLVGASGALTAAETAAICPFDLDQAVDFAGFDTKNVTTERFSVGRKYARPLARRRIEQFESQQCDVQYVPGRSRNVNVNTQIIGMSSRPILLPVWIMAYRYQDRLYRFLVNGQTGRATGHAPKSWKKIAVAAALAVVGALLVVLLLSNLLG